MVSISPFNVLLNNLSSELDQRNLESLVHVCGELIPGGQREGITSGWEVFSILLRRNAIGEEPMRMAFLLGIIKELRPKRRDLVCMVKRYIEDNYERPDEILNDFEFSSDGYIVVPRPSTPLSEENCCSVRCGCCNCGCNPCCSGFCCSVIVAILFIFMAVAAALLWYVYLRKSFNSKEDLKYTGPVVIAGLLVFAVCSVSFGIYIKRRNRQLGFSELQSDYARSESVRTGSTAYVTKIDRRRRNGRECSFSSGHITASSSLNSLWSARTPWPRTDTVVVPDGYGQQNNDFTTQEIEGEDEDGKDQDEFHLHISGESRAEEVTK